MNLGWWVSPYDFETSWVYHYSGVHVFCIFTSLLYLLQAGYSLSIWERPLGFLDYAEALRLTTAITADTEGV